MAYLWFHAFRRDNVPDVLSALTAGPTPGLGTRTAENEEILGIAPACVYAYLGQTFEEFGDCAFCVGEGDLMDGVLVSPFDTGGLVAHLTPVRDWEDEARRAFLAHFSFPAQSIADLLRSYPTTRRERVSAYLRGERPPEPGPHAAFAGRPGDENRVAAIWENAVSPRAWLWEARAPRRLEVGARLTHWSCSASTYQQILRHAEDVVDEVEAGHLAELLRLYIPGGVSSLCLHLIGVQEAA